MSENYYIHHILEFEVIIDFRKQKPGRFENGRCGSVWKKKFTLP